jgi:hypothetical protein
LLGFESFNPCLEQVAALMAVVMTGRVVVAARLAVIDSRPKHAGRQTQAADDDKQADDNSVVNLFHGITPIAFMWW